MLDAFGRFGAHGARDLTCKTTPHKEEPKMPRETVKRSLRLSVSDEPLFAERPEKSASRRENFCVSHFHSFGIIREPRSRRVLLKMRVIIALAPFCPKLLIAFASRAYFTAHNLPLPIHIQRIQNPHEKPFKKLQ